MIWKLYYMMCKLYVVYRLYYIMYEFYFMIFKVYYMMRKLYYMHIWAKKCLRALRDVKFQMHKLSYSEGIGI